MSVMVPENERLVFDGMAFARMQSAILLAVFQRRAVEERVRDDVVPNGEAVAVLRPAAGATVPDFFPASDEVAMSKMPLPPGWLADDRPEDEFEAADCMSPPLEDEFAEAPCPPVRDWATRAQQASMQKKAVRAMRIFMCPFLSWLDRRPCGMHFICS